LGKSWERIGKMLGKEKQWQNTGKTSALTKIFIFFVFSPCPSLSISRGGKFFIKVSSKRPAFLFKEIGGEILRKEAPQTIPLQNYKEW
jgi:hypothetical protein